MRASPLSRVLLLSVLLLAVVSVTAVLPGVQRETVEPQGPADVQLVEPAPNGSVQLWPYTSRSRTFADATLPINVVVRSDAATVRQILIASSSSTGGTLYWNATAGEWEGSQTHREAVRINATGVNWGKSPGAARYTYMQTERGERWTEATYQLHDGRYFATRYHLRLYEGGTGQHTWTAVQAHHEYWDWFRLRHSVDSLSKARHHIERDVAGTRLVSDIKRERYGNGGALDADGWVTVVDLRRLVTRGPKPRSLAPLQGLLPGIGLVVLIVGTSHVAETLAGTHRALRREASALGRDVLETGIKLDHLGLLASTALLPLVVRVGAVTVERTFEAASPVLVGGPFYLLLVVGLPACAILFGLRLPVADGFAVAVIGLGTGLMADYAYLGISALPFGAVVQRVVLLFGLGLIAAGGTRWAEGVLTRHGYRLVGLVIWYGALLWPLLGLG